MFGIDFLIGRKNKDLSIQLAKEMFGYILPMLGINSCERCIDNERNFMVAELDKRVVKRHNEDLLFTI